MAIDDVYGSRGLLAASAAAARAARYAGMRRYRSSSSLYAEHAAFEREADAYPEDHSGDIERCAMRCGGHQDDSCADDDQYPENLVVDVDASDLEVA